MDNTKTCKTLLPSLCDELYLKQRQPEVVPAPAVPDDETLAQFLTSVDDLLPPKVEAPVPPEPTREAFNSRLLFSATSSLSEEALDDQVKELCRRRRRNDELLAALVYEKNLRLATAGREGEFTSWLAQSEIDLPRQTAYDLIHRHANQNGLALPWQLKAANGTEPYDSSVFEINEGYGQPVSDPQADDMKKSKVRLKQDRAGRELSNVMRAYLPCPNPEMRAELKALFTELGEAEVALHIHKLLLSLKDCHSFFRGVFPHWVTVADLPFTPGVIYTTQPTGEKR